MEKKIIDFNAYRQFFDESALWNKLKKMSRKAGIKVVYVALLLYYMALDPSIPRKEKLKEWFGNYDRTEIAGLLPASTQH